MEMQTTKQIMTMLSSIPIGTIITWLLVITGIITAIITATIKLYKVFEKTHKLKKDNDDFRKKVYKHDEQLKDIQHSLHKIQETMNKQEKHDLKKLRYSLVRAGEEYVSKNQITIRQLRSLEEMYSDYRDQYEGNGYVTTLMHKVRDLTVIGKLDENEKDI